MSVPHPVQCGVCVTIRAALEEFRTITVNKDGTLYVRHDIGIPEAVYDTGWTHLHAPRMWDVIAIGGEELVYESDKGVPDVVVQHICVVAHAYHKATETFAHVEVLRRISSYASDYIGQTMIRTWRI